MRYNLPRYIIVALLVVVATSLMTSAHADVILDDVYYWPGVEKEMGAEEPETTDPVYEVPETEYRHVKDDSIPLIRFTLITDTLVKAVIHRPL